MNMFDKKMKVLYWVLTLEPVPLPVDVELSGTDKITH